MGRSLSNVRPSTQLNGGVYVQDLGHSRREPIRLPMPDASRCGDAPNRSA